MIPLRFQAHCHWCGELVDTRPRARNYNYGSGWFQRRPEGGANAVHLVELEPTRWACKFCMDKRLKGATHFQPSLFA